MVKYDCDRVAEATEKSATVALQQNEAELAQILAELLNDQTYSKTTLSYCKTPILTPLPRQAKSAPVQRSYEADGYGS